MKCPEEDNKETYKKKQTNKKNPQLTLLFWIEMRACGGGGEQKCTCCFLVPDKWVHSALVDQNREQVS